MIVRVSPIVSVLTTVTSPIFTSLLAILFLPVPLAYRGVILPMTFVERVFMRTSPLMVTSPGKAWTFVAAIYKYRTIFLAVWDAPKKIVALGVFFSLYLIINYL